MPVLSASAPWMPSCVAVSFAPSRMASGHRNCGYLRLYGVGAGGQGSQADAAVADGAARRGAGAAYLADHEREGHDRARCVVAVGVALHAEALADEAGLGLADLLRQRGDALGGDAGDGACPCGRLLDVVVAGAHDVVVIREVLAARALGHGLLVEAHDVSVQEVDIDQVVLDQLVGERRDERRVGAGDDGNPLGADVRARLSTARVDADDAYVFLLVGDQQVVTRAVACHAHVVGREAEHDHELVVLERFERAIAPRASVNVRVRAEADGRARVAAIARDLTAEQIDQAEERAVHHDVLLDAGAFLDENGFVSVGLDDAIELAGDSVERVIPADALVLAVAALGARDAAHRVVQALLGVQPFADRASAQAGARLDVAELGRAGGVGLHVGDLSVVHMALQRARPTAVHVAVRPDDLVGARRLVGEGDGRRLSERGAAGSAGDGQGSERAGRLGERTTVEHHVLF